MNQAGTDQRERYDEEWNGWKAGAMAFDDVRRHDQINSELTRVLRRGGHIMLTVPNVAFWRSESRHYAARCHP